MRVRREIVYPFFLHCCRETRDSFWRYVFEDLAYGKAPYGAYFSRGFLCCSFKGREFSYKVDPHRVTTQLFEEVRSILQERLGLRSCEDLRKQRDKFHESSLQKGLSECEDWSTVKRKETRSLLLTDYVLRLFPELKKSEIRKIYSLLSLALQMKLLVSDDLDIKNGRIVEIKKIVGKGKEDLESFVLNLN